MEAKVQSYDLKKKSLKQIIELRLKDLGVSRYALAMNLDARRGKRIAPSTTFRFLSGECDTMVENVELMLRACGLQVVAEDEAPSWVKNQSA